MNRRNRITKTKIQQARTSATTAAKLGLSAGEMADLVSALSVTYPDKTLVQLERMAEDLARDPKRQLLLDIHRRYQLMSRMFYAIQGAMVPNLNALVCEMNDDYVRDTVRDVVRMTRFYSDIAR